MFLFISYTVDLFRLLHFYHRIIQVQSLVSASGISYISLTNLNENTHLRNSMATLPDNYIEECGWCS
jgi:hypothetical protein